MYDALKKVGFREQPGLQPAYGVEGGEATGRSHPGRYSTVPLYGPPLRANPYNTSVARGALSSPLASVVDWRASP